MPLTFIGGSNTVDSPRQLDTREPIVRVGIHFLTNFSVITSVDAGFDRRGRYDPFSDYLSVYEVALLVVHSSSFSSTSGAPRFAAFWCSRIVFEYATSVQLLQSVWIWGSSQSSIPGDYNCTLLQRTVRRSNQMLSAPGQGPTNSSRVCVDAVHTIPRCKTCPRQCNATFNRPNAGAYHQYQRIQHQTEKRRVSSHKLLSSAGIPIGCQYRKSESYLKRHQIEIPRQLVVFVTVF
ncbi:hypothetical protein R3P38DRAFT_1354328 [Favolaschia claudopus]|uniref:Uncharacterized protein n=1 Tax=Favolaschia claudopus TaxID=2862362 RepID=A0AAW0DU83_9AGAR